MKLSTRTQFISALVVAAAWACSSEPAGDTTTNTPGTGGTVGNGGNTVQPGGGTTSNAGTQGNAGTQAGGSGGAAGGSAPVAGTGGTVTAGAGGAAGGAPGGAGGTPAGGAANCDGLPAGVQGHPDCSITYPTYEGFTLALAEEFSAPIDLVNDPVWTYSDGGLDEGTVRFVKDNITFEAGTGNVGVMKLNFTEDPVAESFSHAEEKPVGTKEFSSGEFRTKYNNYRYGRYEVRFKAPSVTTANPDAPGGYVATTFIFRTPKFTNWREIDIEQTGYTATSLTTNLINGDNRAGWAADFASAADTTLASSGRTEFHTYAFEWIEGQISWFVDDMTTPFRTETGGGIAIPDMSGKIMMNLWAGAFGGDPNANEYPIATEYDWFRFYKWDMETTYPVADPATNLPATDKDGSKNNPEDGVEDIPPNAGN
ncbi:MAG TPA: family 16 glycosylhydrolase [Polyangiaceae bacterium]|nr:family 16 glycosylhydrolase [Polyangiaceae bacterium]